ncbi:MAG TPA: hypothetical protein DCZ01_01745 [Elusimicrobia bacterium]|nr:MAG: hypothetical protein A2X37_07395 [Elusimicrobia bacterium GWA2_66_18]HAZ07253.1 hypothetical protein [Elusimicrobiota bacterium]
MKSTLLKVVGLGAISAAAGFLVMPERFWANALLAGLFTLTVSLGAALFLAIQYVSDASWSRGLRRICECLAASVVVGEVLVFLAVAFGARSLYGWIHAHGHLPHAQELWLFRPFQFSRLFVYFGVWSAMIFALLKRPSRGLAAAFLAVFAVTFTLAGMDWVMALEPHWFSTMFGLYLFAGTFQCALAVIIVMAVLLRETDAMRRVVNADLYHDLGKLLFGFSSFWAYIWFCQFLLIWYSNLPEEAGFHLLRLSGGWGALSALTVVLNWAVPFFVLMTRSAKRNSRVIFRVGLGVILGHWLDLYVLVMPRFLPHGPSLAGWEAGLMAGVIAAFGWTLACLWSRTALQESGMMPSRLRTSATRPPGSMGF